MSESDCKLGAAHEGDCGRATDRLLGLGWDIPPRQHGDRHHRHAAVGEDAIERGRSVRFSVCLPRCCASMWSEVSGISHHLRCTLSHGMMLAPYPRSLSACT